MHGVVFLKRIKRGPSALAPRAKPAKSVNIDLTSSESPLADVNMKELINRAMFESFSPEKQQILLSKLHRCDVVAQADGSLA